MEGPIQHTINSLERMGALPPSHYKGKVLLPLIWNIDMDVPDYLIGDTMRLTQILLNLCSNAVKVNGTQKESIISVLTFIFTLPCSLQRKAEYVYESDGMYPHPYNQAISSNSSSNPS
jgi:nitrogen-specific signal transduction histidine kinase